MASAARLMSLVSVLMLPLASGCGQNGATGLANPTATASTPSTRRGLEAQPWMAANRRRAIHLGNALKPPQTPRPRCPAAVRAAREVRSLS